MIPVTTPNEMREIDASAPEPVEVLVERAGAAVARYALDVLGGTYGRRVAVVAGKGNNGADGRAAARRLEARGIRVAVFDASRCPDPLPTVDLVIDAAYGTGFRGDYAAPDPGDAFVLAVDIPSGLDGLTGNAAPTTVRADATVTFAALKPGLLLDRSVHTGIVAVADIGLDASTATAHLMEPIDISPPRRPDGSHKYWAGTGVIAGSPGMTGAAVLCARSAFRAGSGYVRLGIPGLDAGPAGITEAVGIDLRASAWAEDALDACGHMKAIAIGPGLGRRDSTLAQVRAVVEKAEGPVVIDGDALRAAFGAPPPEGQVRVLTPHDGEYEALAGGSPGPDRLAAARGLAAASAATVLLKGPVTIVAAPTGEARFVTTGGPVLATAGTGDVLTGVVASFLARGMRPLDAASMAACAHGLAARAAGRGEGLVAGDLADALPEVLWRAR